MTGNYEPYIERLEDTLQRAVGQGGAAAPLYQMMGYHLGWLNERGQEAQATSGKRVRPLLCLLVAEGYGAELESALPAAAALELLHNFTLIHDDIQDGSTERRHRTTVWKIWGLAQGINAGDALHCIARLTMLRLSDHGVDGERTLAAAKLFDETCLSICEGQFLDVQFETRVDVIRAEYGAMIARKTAALVACATKMGALIAGAPSSQQDVMWHFGQSLGLAYQVQDDILGIWGDPRVTGKPAADDIRSRKKTLPILFLLEHGSARQRQVLAEVWRQEQVEDAGIDAVLSALNEAGARQFAEGEAARLYTSTQQYLAEARITAASRASLGSLVGSLLLRPA